MREKLVKTLIVFYIYTIVYKKNYPKLIWTTKNYKKHYEKKIKKNNIKINTFWMENGLQSWKPQIILCYLNKIKKNDYLIYHDINFKKYKFYLENFNLNQNYYKKITNNKSIILFRDTYQSIESQCKSELIKKYLNKNFNFRKNGFWSGLVIVKNNKIGKKFIQNWCKLSTISNLDPFSKKDYLSNPKFIINAVDQSTLSILYYSNQAYRNQVKILYAPYRRLISYKIKNLYSLYSLARSIKEFIRTKFREFIGMI